MLAIQQITNTEAVVYSCPPGKSAYVFVDIFCASEDRTANVTIKVNDVVYYSDNIVSFMSCKLTLTTGDVIKISTNTTVNVFIHGMEV